MTRAARVLALVAFAATPLAAQQAAPRPPAAAHGSRFLIHWGKWATAAGAITLTALGAREHHYSDAEWNQLLDICRNNNADCMVGPNGRYVNRPATAALFITDLRHHTAEPGNIPFKPVSLEVSPTRDGGRVGMRVAF